MFEMFICEEVQSSSAAAAASRVVPDQSGLVLTSRDKLTAHSQLSGGRVYNVCVFADVCSNRGPHWTTGCGRQRKSNAHILYQLLYGSNGRRRKGKMLQEKQSEKLQGRRVTVTVNVLWAHAPYKELGTNALKSIKWNKASLKIQHRTSVSPFTWHMQTQLDV